MQNRILIDCSILTVLVFAATGYSGDLCKEGREVSTPKAHYCPVQKDGKEVKYGNVRKWYVNGRLAFEGRYESWNGT